MFSKITLTNKIIYNYLHKLWIKFQNFLEHSVHYSFSLLKNEIIVKIKTLKTIIVNGYMPIIWTDSFIILISQHELKSTIISLKLKVGSSKMMAISNIKKKTTTFDRSVSCIVFKCSICKVVILKYLYHLFRYCFKYHMNDWNYEITISNYVLGINQI